MQSMGDLILVWFPYMQRQRENKFGDLHSAVFWHNNIVASGAPMPPSAMLTLKLTRKAQLTQRGTRNSGVCLKAHCEQNLSSRISAIDIGHNNFHPFTRIRQVAIPDSHRGVIKGEGLKGLRTPQGFMISVFFSVNSTWPNKADWS